MTMTLAFIFMVNMHKTTANELQVVVVWLRLLMSKYKLIITCLLMWQGYQSLPVSLLLLCGLSPPINSGSHDIAESDNKHHADQG